MKSLTIDDGVINLTVHPTSFTLNETNKSYTMKIPKSDIDYTQIIDRYLGGSLTLSTYEELEFLTDVTVDIVVDDLITYTAIITGMNRDIQNIKWTYNLKIINKVIV